MKRLHWFPKSRKACSTCGFKPPARMFCKGFQNSARNQFSLGIGKGLYWFDRWADVRFCVLCLSNFTFPTKSCSKGIQQRKRNVCQHVCSNPFKAHMVQNKSSGHAMFTAYHSFCIQISQGSGDHNCSSSNQTSWEDWCRLCLAKCWSLKAKAWNLL